MRAASITCTRIVAVAGAGTVAVAIVATVASAVAVAAHAGALTVAADTGALTVAADTGARAVTLIVIVIGICRFNIRTPTHRAGGITICPCML